MTKSLLQAKQVRNEALEEAYTYFDRNIRPLTRLPSGKVNPSARGLEDNDVDAFRHAYVSGVFTQVYGENTADVFGRLAELSPYFVGNDLMRRLRTFPLNGAVAGAFTTAHEH